MNLQQLRYVRALCEEGSFVAAAARCAVTQPTLSNGLAQLEAELGQRIFNRTTRSVGLTHFGEQLLPGILETLRAYDRLRELTRRTESANVCFHIGISPLVGIRLAEELLEEFRSSRPEIAVVYREGNLTTLCDEFKREQLDLIIAPFDEQFIPSGDFLLQSVCCEPLLFLPRSDDAERWSNVAHVDLQDISREAFVLVPNACGLAHVTKRIFDNEHLTLNRYPGEASSYAAVQEWTLLGMGCGILPASKLHGESRNRAIAIQKDGAPVNITYFALGRPNTVPPSLLDELWEALRPDALAPPCPQIVRVAN
ncbi:MAG: LysR family transcriptional regulator [Hyphomicrobium sp.]|jgi:DNA-binding transcriptional LysR family regulator